MARYSSFVLYNEILQLSQQMPSGISMGALFLSSVSSSLSTINLNILIALRGVHKYFALFLYMSHSMVQVQTKCIMKFNSCVLIPLKINCIIPKMSSHKINLHSCPLCFNRILLVAYLLKSPTIIKSVLLWLKQE